MEQQISKERLGILLYNAIVVLEEANETVDHDEILYELGMTQEEYDKIMEA